MVLGCEERVPPLQPPGVALDIPGVSEGPQERHRQLLSVGANFWDAEACDSVDVLEQGSRRSQKASERHARFVMAQLRVRHPSEDGEPP
eukprot:765540-Hanusia_phi.AAC.5